jgi:hypothetical protein
VNAARWIALWAGFLAVLTALMAFFADIDPISPLLLGGAAGGTALLAILALGARDDSAARRADGLGDSPGTAAAALGVTLLVGGAEVGEWMLGIGAAFLLVGAAGLVRERRAR